MSGAEMASGVLLLACVVSAARGAAPATGPLKVHPTNPRWFADGAGRAIWLTGSHTWASRQERGVEGTTPDFDYAGYLAFLQRHGHNFIRLWAWEHAQWMQFVGADVLVRYTPLPWARTGPGNALDGKPKLDQAVGDVDGDGEDELVFLSQRGGVLMYYDIPADPLVQPWPRECCHAIAEDIGYDTEGLRVVDIDGDGVVEVITGADVFRPTQPGKPWRRAHSFPGGFFRARLAITDLDGDGRLDLVLAEGESHPARLAVCLPWNAEPRIFRAGLFHPHSLEVADFDGDGRPDIFVGEMGLGRNPDPKLLVFLNRGGASFEEVVVQHGVPTHEAKVADINGDGRPDIVGKPYSPERHIDLWLNET